MEVEIIKKTKELLTVNWAVEGVGFGQLNMKYNDKGGFIIDSEYLSMTRVLEILSEVNKLINK